MITKIEVDGFKSLKDFELTFNPGLNILVGPNGAGKTNIIQFLEFISQSVTDSLSNIVKNFGGTGVIFHKVGEESYLDIMQAKIYGLVLIGNEQYHYEYSFSINQKLFFAKQELIFKSVKAEDSEFSENYDVHLFTESPDGITHSPIKTLKGKGPDILINEQFLQNPHYSIIFVLQNFRQELFFLDTIRNDLRAHQNLNIIPNKVRESEDASSLPEIDKDGSGTAATLYALESKLYTMSQGLPPDSFLQIKKHLQDANSTIKDIRIEKDNFDITLLIKVVIESNGYSTVLPLSAMSDGTLKWLTLITAIYTSLNGLSIEEPENFLHPWMQAELVSILRGYIEEKDFPIFALLTTHSESLINAVEPEEIILVDIQGGKTVTRRIENVKGVKDEISNSGLGLGHFYFSNILASVMSGVKWH